jgi:O-antigen ligase
MLAMRLPFARLQVRYLGRYALGTVLLVLLFYAVPDVREGLVAFLGKDMTLTGRTDIWAALLSEPINPLLGTGYQSFWLGPRAEHYWQRWIFHPNQAHNGYLETYINGGLVGVCLLMALIVSTGMKFKTELLQRSSSSYSALRFSFFVVSLVYNWTEAGFNRLGPIWFVFLVATLSFRRPSRATVNNIVRSSNGGPARCSSKKESTVTVVSGAAHGI